MPWGDGVRMWRAWGEEGIRESSQKVVVPGLVEKLAYACKMTPTAK